MLRRRTRTGRGQPARLVVWTREKMLALLTAVAGVQVALRARLALSPAESLCTRGATGPLTPYLPSGAYG